MFHELGRASRYGRRADGAFQGASRQSHFGDPGGDPDLAEKIDRCCATIKESLTIFKKDYDSHGAVLLIDSAERSPYSSGSGSAGFNQINILNEARQLVDLQTRSQVVASLKAFQLFRVYLPDEAAAQRKQVVEIIDRELKKCR